MLKGVIDLIANTEAPADLTAALERSLEAVMQHFDVADREVTLVLVDDSEIRQLKLEHWGEDEVTDVLSFPTWEPGDPFMPPHLGDIIISLDTAARQAQARGHSLTYEAALLSSHGMTHLVGHDHPHAAGLGFEEGATGEQWQVFHDACAAAKATLPPPTPTTATP